MSKKSERPAAWAEVVVVKIIEAHDPHSKPPTMEEAEQNYKGCTAAQKKRCLTEDAAKLAEWNGDVWHYVGIYLRATVAVHLPDGTTLQTATIRTPGLWGVESYSGDDYKESIAREEFATLRVICEALNIRVMPKDLTGGNWDFE